MRLLFFIHLVMLGACCSLSAREGGQKGSGETYKQVYIVAYGDTIPYFQLPQVLIFTQLTFKNNVERQKYSKLVRDVRRAYPYARMVAASIIETYEYMETIPDEKAKQKHLEEVQKYMMDKYKPELKKMTRTQGRILIKLIDRECNVSSYEIVKALLGSIRAGVYNIFAGVFGNSLKAKYDPTGEDALIEEIVLQIEQGTVDHYYTLNYHGYRQRK